MKKIFTAIIITITSTAAFAHSGGHELTCRSAKNSGSHQPIKISLARANTVGLWAPKISIAVKRKKHTLDTQDDMVSYGETFHNSPLGVITVTVSNRDENTAVVFGGFSIVAIPNSVRAYDPQGRPMKWKFTDEKDDCYDSAGRARFHGIFRGHLKSYGKDIPLETQVLECELTYTSGMAC